MELMSTMKVNPFAKAAVAAWPAIEIDSIWDDAKTREPVLLEFDDDPLAFVCSQLRIDGMMTDIHSTLSYHGRKEQRDAMSSSINSEDRVRASLVKKYFLNSIMMRRLHNKPISAFMEKVEKIFDKDEPFIDDYLSPLVTLPLFYKESMQTMAIFEKHTSLEQPGRSYTQPMIDEVVTFAGMVRRHASKENEERYYFSTKDGHLVGFFVKVNDMSSPAWTYLLSKPSFRITGPVSVQPQAGHDFYFYKPGGGYEIHDS
jgi:hypothetical protein